MMTEATWVWTGRFCAVILLAACGANDPLEYPVSQPAPAAQGFIGSEACKGCHGPYLPTTVHGTLHADWRASAHGRATDTAPSEQSIVADWNGNGATDFRDGLDLASVAGWSAIASAGAAPVLGFDAGRGAYFVTIGPRTFDVERTVGTGRGSQAYVTRIGSSRYVLPLLYDAVRKTWRPLDPENWYRWNDTDTDGRLDAGETVTGPRYAEGDTPASVGRATDAWERRCAGCHTTGLVSVDVAAGQFVAEWSEDGIGCEACHGPGRLHAEQLGGSGLPGRGIANPRKLDATARQELCVACHALGNSVGTVGGTPLAFPWRADGTRFLPDTPLSDAFTPGSVSTDAIHALQGNAAHVGQDCLTCHTGHDTTNLARVRMRIDTPSSGPRDVVLTTRVGAPGTGGLLGDATDAAFTDACEVCHTATRYHRNDGSQPFSGHHDGEDCTACHPHSSGFRPAESTGGIDCDACHTDLGTAMSVGLGHGHVLDDTSATFPLDSSALNCLSCHVDHDLFGPDDRGANLRAELTAVPTGTADTADTDFLGTGGGICLSCHTAPRNRSGGGTTASIPYEGAADPADAYGAGAHGAYTVASDFSGGGRRTFRANCGKCHNDTLEPKSEINAQGGAHRFGLHVSARSGILSPLGFAGAEDPLEEQFCYRCHSAAGDAVGGAGKPAAGRDWYDTTAMSDRSEGIWAAGQAAYVHPVGSARGRHDPLEGMSPGWNPASDRHVECADCHNPHATGAARGFDTTGRFAQPAAPSSAAAGTPLANVWGVDPGWPAAWTAPAATAFARVETSAFSWQVCLKCHSAYAYGATPPAGQTDQALEFNPNNPSYHAVIGSSRTTVPPDSSFVAPWTRSSPMACSDCHTSNDKTGAQGPHGSAIRGILAGAFDSTTGQAGSEGHLCFKCHSFNAYGRSGSAGTSATGFSGEGRNLHVFHMGRNHYRAGRRVTCWDCHAAVPHGWKRRALLVVTTDAAPYNNGDAALSAADVAGWPASGGWREESCRTSPCH